MRHNKPSDHTDPNRKKAISESLTSDLRKLSSLTVFEVMGNNLTREIPNLSGLISLERVFVNDNSFTSIDEDFFTGLKSLRFVNLDNNPLRPWEIPFSLTDATSLEVFSAANCSLFGRIPENFLWSVTFPNLTALELSDNSLVGELPMSFAGSYVQILRLNGQKLNESISVLTKMHALTKVWLQENRFSGTIPDFSGPSSLKLFNVSGNQLTGIVPSSLTRLTSLLDVDLGNNTLQGPTPSFNAKSITLELNSFCLDVPGAPCDSRVNALLSIVEGFGYPVVFAESWKGNDPCNISNMWVGITCSGSDITVINFKDMGLTGIISESFSLLKALKVIDLSHNNLTVCIPEVVTELSNLKTLDVSYNDHVEPNVFDVSGDPGVGNYVPQPAYGSLGSSSRNNAGKIAASVIGATVLLLLLIGFVVFLCLKKKKQHLKMHPQQHSCDLKITIGYPIAHGTKAGLGHVVL